MGLLNKIYSMPEASINKLVASLSTEVYPKGFRILEAGKIERNVFFIKKGIVRAYVLVDGKELTFWLAGRVIP